MPNAASVSCPSCRAPMAQHEFARKLGGNVQLDLCFACQGVWFDTYESLQLAPAGTIALFELIHRPHESTPHPVAPTLRCPRCDELLIHSQDRVKSGLFNYWRCTQNHGRFVSFGQFMIEKGFVRQLNPAEIAELQAHIGAARCPNCGAAVDIRRESACSHCRTPIAILDPDAAQAALEGYRRAEQPAPGPDNANIILAETLLARERERSRLQRERPEIEIDPAGLLIEGLALLCKTFSK